MVVLILSHDHYNVSKTRSQYVFLSIFTLYLNLIGVPLISNFILTLHFTQLIMLYPTNFIILKSDHPNVPFNDLQVQKTECSTLDLTFTCPIFTNYSTHTLKDSRDQALSI